MNKKFVSLMVCSLLLGGAASTTLVSCSDHDDDITNLNNTTADLNKQLAALQEALKVNEEAAKQADAAAKQALADAAKAAQSGDAAAAEAKKAAAEAELAKEAASKAKAEAVAAAIEQVKTLIAGKADATEVAKLAGRIEGIEKGLINGIDLNALNKELGDQAETIKEQAKSISTIQGQIRALELFKDSLAGLDGRLDGIDGKITTINNTLDELKGLKNQVETNKTDIATLQGQMSQISGQISTAINNNVNTIAGVLSNRLTSVTLMPDVYMDGIPTIDFESAKYIKQVQKGNYWVDATEGKTTYIISNNTAEAHYRLNPGTIKEEDIIGGQLEYVTRIATTRGAELPASVVKVSDWKIENNGSLTVYLGKNNTESLNLPNNEIYTVSLKVPIATDHLFVAQGETSASVYSEFTRLNETYFRPELMFVPGATNVPEKYSHMYTYDEVYKSKENEMIAKNISYYPEDGDPKGTYDLYKLVEGCGFFSTTDTHKPLTVADLDKYGLEIVFEKCKQAYQPTADKTNQQ